VIVLDTHVWLWWTSSPDHLSAAAASAIAEADRIVISTLSCWEVAMLSERGRITLDRPIGQWVRAALRADERTVAVGPDENVAVAAALLGSAGFHGDPADRFIYATTTALDATLVTRDEAIRRFDRTRAVW
jgi:PIN domain nuclease of toxin-antitoxin system